MNSRRICVENCLRQRSNVRSKMNGTLHHQQTFFTWFDTDNSHHFRVKQLHATACNHHLDTANFEHGHRPQVARTPAPHGTTEDELPIAQTLHLRLGHNRCTM
ncbi:MAG: hypothetical protein VX877_08985 [Planctomycetota bacterium]|nr:hypothetical protein [Planctomycetota bacterium]